jgi:hypothetical protein
LARARATLRLGLACDNRCVFCAQRGLGADELTPTELAARFEALRRDSDELTFTGGEPLLYPSLPQAIAGARAAGFRRVGLQTNARRLAEQAEALVRAGLTDVHVSVHGARAAVHDYHTGAPGSFAALWAGVARARALGVTVAASTVLTRSNFRVLDELPALLSSRGVAAWRLLVPRAAGEAAIGFDRVMPRLGLALPFALHALDAAARRGLPAFIEGAPACALGPFAARALPDEPRAFAPVCASCPARAACPGVDAAYLDRFGGDELAARDLPAAFATDPAAQLFDGIGELAPAPPPAAPQRLALPLLGKSQPARKEVAVTAPRKTGEALRELFPALFDKPSEKPSEEP